MRGSNLSNVGAHAAAFVSLRKGLGLMSSVYRIPAGYFRGRCVLTNTVPTTPYRSAGRPEAIFVMERLVDLAARQCGFDPGRAAPAQHDPARGAALSPIRWASPTTTAATARRWRRR